MKVTIKRSPLYLMTLQNKNMSMNIPLIPLLNGEHPVISGTASPTSGSASGSLSSSLFRSSSSHRRFRSSLVLRSHQLSRWPVSALRVSLFRVFLRRISISKRYCQWAKGAAAGYDDAHRCRDYDRIPLQCCDSVWIAWRRPLLEDCDTDRHHAVRPLIEMRSVMGASRSFEELARLMPSDVHKLMPDESVQDVSLDALMVADCVFVNLRLL